MAKARGGGMINRYNVRVFMMVLAILLMVTCYFSISIPSFSSFCPKSNCSLVDEVKVDKNCTRVVVALQEKQKTSNAATTTTTATTTFKQWHATKTWHYEDRFPLCNMDACFNFSRCENMENLLIYHYGPPFAPTRYFRTLPSSNWSTNDPNKACLFMLSTDSEEPKRPVPSTLPYWNGGLNHILVTFADMWRQKNPPPELMGNASVLSTELHETTYRSGFDIAIPLLGKIHATLELRSLPPYSRRYFATFKGLRYLGPGEGQFRSLPSLKAMHNGRDIIVALSCRHPVNDFHRKRDPPLGYRCDEDDASYPTYNFGELMNTTFALVPAGISPSSYRFIEVLSAGAIPVLICDNYVKPFETLIQWSQCLLHFPTQEMHRIIPALRGLSRQEVLDRQRYCIFVYNEYLKDDETLLRSVVRALKLRFNGMFANLSEHLPHFPSSATT